MACQKIVQISIPFADGSATLDPVQVKRLAAWLEKAQATHPGYTEASVEAGASVEATNASLADTQKLARHRAKSTAEALTTLFPVELPVIVSSHAYRKRQEFPASTNDFASVQLYPDLQGQTLPDCNPVPIPDLKPAQPPHSPDPNADASRSPRQSSARSR